MQTRSLPGALILFSLSLNAQVPDDILKYSWQPTNGTARINAIGGAMGSLGGDISALFANPAGLGLYKTSEMAISPGFYFLKNKSNFRGNSDVTKTSNLNLGASGIVYSWAVPKGKFINETIGIGVTRTANFTNKIYYKGSNDFSSHAEQYAAEAAGSGLSLDEMLNDNNISLGTRMALFTYLIDSATLGININPDVVALAMYDQLKNGGPFQVNQSHSIETSGGITEIGFGIGSNKNDKMYVGLAFGLPIVEYQKKSNFREEDAGTDNNNNFSFSELSETTTTKGVGFNLKMGIIVKPIDQLRLGFTIHSPTWYGLTDIYKATMSVNTENYRNNPGTEVVSANLFNDGKTPKYKYVLLTPLKFIVSGAYVIREIEDVRRQRGFLTADIEYVTYKTNKLIDYDSVDRHGYYDAENATIRNYYKGAFNFRIGGELKFTTIMTRLGFSYYGNPYADGELNAGKMLVSGGLGYRKGGIFIDVTYIHSIQKDVSFPYRLPDKANTFANIKQTGGNVMLTVGFKI